MVGRPSTWLKLASVSSCVCTMHQTTLRWSCADAVCTSQEPVHELASKQLAVQACWQQAAAEQPAGTSSSANPGPLTRRKPVRHQACKAWTCVRTTNPRCTCI